MEYALDKYDTEADMADPFACEQELDPTVAEVKGACAIVSRGCEFACTCRLWSGSGNDHLKK